MKSEADCFSFADLMAQPGKTTFWDGIRNFEVRNMLRDKIQIGDKSYAKAAVIFDKIDSHSSKYVLFCKTKREPNHWLFCGCLEFYSFDLAPRKATELNWRDKRGHHVCFASGLLVQRCGALHAARTRRQDRGRERTKQRRHDFQHADDRAHQSQAPENRSASATRAGIVALAMSFPSRGGPLGLG